MSLLFYSTLAYLIFYGVLRKFGLSPNILLPVPYLLTIPFYFYFSKFIKDSKSILYLIFIVNYAFISLISFVVDIFENPYLIILQYTSYFAFIQLCFYSFNLSGLQVYEIIKFIRYISFVQIGFGLFQLFFIDLIDSPLLKQIQTDAEIYSHSFGNSSINFLTGTFDVVTRYSSFLLFSFLVNLFYYRISPTKFNLFIILINFIVLFLCGHRTPVMILLFVLAWDIYRYRIFYNKLSLFLVFPFLYTIFFVDPFNLGDSNIINAIIYGIYAIWYSKDRFLWFLYDFYAAFTSSKFLGLGAGSASQGIDLIPFGMEQITWVKNNIQYSLISDEYSTGLTFFSGIESGVGKIFVEYGPIFGLIFLIIHSLLVYKYSLSLNKLLPINSIGRIFSLYVQSIFLWGMVVHHQILGDPLTMILFWFSFGVLIRLSKEFHLSN